MRHKTRVIASSFIAVCVVAFMTASSRAQDSSLAQLPLLKPENLKYLGAFNLPGNDGTGSPQGDLTYGGQAMSVTPAGTLLLGGHTWYTTLCEFSIPEMGGTATVVQPCTDVTEGLAGNIDPGNQVEFGGSLVYGGRLILSTYSYYDADKNTVLSHFASSTNFGAGGDVVGPVQVGTAGAGFVSGYMGLVPEEWRSAFGGPALTGNCCLNIISRTSAGPSLSVFNPDDVGNVSPVPATTLLAYPIDQPIVPNITAQNPTYVRGDVVGGVAFPSGSRTVLFVGRHGTGTPCYDEGAVCGDPTSPYKGDHAYPYIHQVWAYDANDLLAVKNGQMKPSDVRPYATWPLISMNTSGDSTMVSTYYDQATRRLYIAEYYGTDPKIHVYEVVGVGGGSGTQNPQTPTSPAPSPCLPTASSGSEN